MDQLEQPVGFVASMCPVVPCFPFGPQSVDSQMWILSAKSLFQGSTTYEENQPCEGLDLHQKNIGFPTHKWFGMVLKFSTKHDQTTMFIHFFISDGEIPFV